MNKYSTLIIAAAAAVLFSACSAFGSERENVSRAETPSVLPSSETVSAQKKDVTEGITDSGAFCVVNNNVPFFFDSEITSEDFETYSPLDELGRCGTAFANICAETMPTEERGKIGAIKPSGWHTVKYNGLIEGNYLYNRCHLIGYQLAGENANECDLITGTRYMNTVGMLPFENLVAEHIRENGGHVLYRVTPVFEKNDLLADGVLIEARSVEDGGELEFCVFCYNIQPGITIDYKTGESKIADGTPIVSEESGSSSGAFSEGEKPAEQTAGGETATDDITDNEEVLPAVTVEEADYVLNTNTKRFHLPSCPSSEEMKERNKQLYHGTREELIESGYKPCQRCSP